MHVHAGWNEWVDDDGQPVPVDWPAFARPLRQALERQRQKTSSEDELNVVRRLLGNGLLRCGTVSASPPFRDTRIAFVCALVQQVHGFRIALAASCLPSGNHSFGTFLPSFLSLRYHAVICST